MADAKGKPKSNRGGKRPGAGRKKSEIQCRREQVNAAMDRIVLPQVEAVLKDMVLLARGLREYEVWVPVEGVNLATLVCPRDARGNPTIRARRDGDEVLVGKELMPTEDGPDFRAQKYLIDRYLGMPRPALDLDNPDDVANLPDEQLESIRSGKGRR